MIADFFFDAATTDVASDECLAFRSANDAHDAFFFRPRGDASYALARHGESAVPGLASYLADQAARPRTASESPTGISIWLLALLAQHGDHPVLQEFDEFTAFQTAQMRQCIHSGHHVVWKTNTWACDP